MTRIVVYGSALVALIAGGETGPQSTMCLTNRPVSAMTLASILTPSWVSLSVRTTSGGLVYRSDGLHRSCSNEYPFPGCREFPDEVLDCRSGGGGGGGVGGEGHHFCSMWRTTGFLMNLAVVAELATVFAFLLIMAGGRQKREGGWQIAAGLLGAVAAAQFCATAIVAYLFDNGKEYLVPDWHLGSSWILCTVGAGVAVLTGLGLAASAFLLPPEGGYELLDGV